MTENRNPSVVTYTSEEYLSLGQIRQMRVSAAREAITKLPDSRIELIVMETIDIERGIDRLTLTQKQRNDLRNYIKLVRELVGLPNE